MRSDSPEKLKKSMEEKETVDAAEFEKNKPSWKVGDKAYYVEPETDSEVECYVSRAVETPPDLEKMWWVKLRHTNEFGILPESRLTHIDPPGWETLEENIKRTDWRSNV